MQTQPTTPFGRRQLSLAMVASQAATEAFRVKPDARERVVHKWRLFRALTEAKEPLGVNDRALSVLHALLSFHQETALMLPASETKAGEGDSSSPGLVVFPSNKELSIRAHGMAPATLRRHLACLVDAGLIIRRDSPNGKRFARRGQGGAIEDAFGFDLTPLVARAEEIENLAEEVRAENRAIALLREKITLTRRDIVKMIETGLEEGVSTGATLGSAGINAATSGAAGQETSDWEGFHRRYATLSARYGRKMARAGLEALATELTVLAAEIRNPLETHVKAQNMSANESQSERHIQNQTTNISDLEPGLQEGRANSPEPSDEDLRAPSRIQSGDFPSRKLVRPRRQSRRSNRNRRGPIRLAWCLRPVPTSSTSRRAGYRIGATSRRRRRSCAAPWACRPTPGPERSRFWASMTPRSSSPRSCSAAMRSNPPAAICAS